LDRGKGFFIRGHCGEAVSHGRYVDGTVENGNIRRCKSRRQDSAGKIIGFLLQDDKMIGKISHRVHVNPKHSGRVIERMLLDGNGGI
jgi:hypothetical protein